MSILNMPLIIQDTAAIEGDMGMMWMLISGILVFFMQAGFFLVESGMTDSKNAVNIAMKNFLDIAVGSLGFLVCWIFTNVWCRSRWRFLSLGRFYLFSRSCRLFFQTVFAATAATIVSRLLQEEQSTQRMLFLVLY